MDAPVTRRAAIGVAAAVLVALAASGCAATTAGTGHPGPAAVQSRASSGASSGSGSSSRGTPAAGAPRPVATKTVMAADGTRYPIKVWAQRQVSDCAAHAYGPPVVGFLRRHRCAQLRQLLATTTVRGRTVDFAQRAIVFSGPPAQRAAAARRFERLVTREGTGNLNDLLREGVRMPGGHRQVPFPNAFSALFQDSAVTVVEAWYHRGVTPSNDPALVKMARDLFLRI